MQERLRWFGHVKRRPPEYIANVVYSISIPVKGAEADRNGGGGPRQALALRVEQLGPPSRVCSVYADGGTTSHPNSPSTDRRLRWPGVVSRHSAPVVSSWSTTAAGMRGANSQALHRLLLEHDCFAEGGDGFPFPLAPDHGLNQGRTREVAAAYWLDDDTAVPFPGSAHLDCVLHRVLSAVRMVVK
ncbi:hypothetical protein B5X24_HaOG211211 [Helicoverpa armigera]|nr:hypothetical protein B5X24_HaOG211211 [Helicoverpa armigera]